MDEEIRALERAAKDDPEAAKALEAAKRRTGWTPPVERVDPVILKILAEAVKRPNVNPAHLPRVAALVREFLTSPDRIGADARELETRWHSPKHRLYGSDQRGHHDEEPMGELDLPPKGAAVFTDGMVQVTATKNSGRPKIALVSVLLGLDPERPQFAWVAAAEARGDHVSPWDGLGVAMPHVRKATRTVLRHLELEGVAMDREVLLEWALKRGLGANPGWPFARREREPKPIMPRRNRWGRR